MPRTFLVFKTAIKPNLLNVVSRVILKTLWKKRRNVPLTGFVLSLEANLYKTSILKNIVSYWSNMGFYQAKWSCEQNSMYINCHRLFSKFLNIPTSQRGCKRVMKPMANWQMDIMLCSAI